MYKRQEISNEKYGYSNCSIKAFTQDVTPKAKITFEKSDPKSLVYISDASGFEFTPKANGTYSVPEGEYLYTASEYEQDDITGTFLAEGTDKTLYIYDDPAEISEAGEGFSGLLEECGQSWLSLIHISSQNNAYMMRAFRKAQKRRNHGHGRSAGPSTQKVRSL